MSNASIPAHVPPSVVRDFDYLDTRGETDFFVSHRKAQQDADIFYTPRNGGHWVVTRYADMHEIIGNHTQFSSYYSSLPKSPVNILLLESDEPLHGEYRKLMMPFFTPKYVGDLEQRAVDLTAALIDGFYADGECDFTHDFAEKMPIYILMSLLDLPLSDRPELLQFSDDMVRAADPAVLESAFAKLADYVGGKVLPARRASPGKDLFTAMLNGRIESGRALNQEELVVLGCLMIAAGVETVASMLSFIAMFLARNPSHRRQLLQQPDNIKHALEELMRRFHITVSARVVIEDMRYNGVDFKAGDIVQLLGTVAGLDERRYPDPFTVDFEREDNRHLVFGRGTHQCIGSFLARTELRVFLTQWLERIPEFRIKEGTTPVLVPGKTCGVRSLHLAWDT
ncbi:MAG: cytochrome P450 [Steroidobacteraceae bacterium]